MALLPIRTYPDEVLRRKAVPVDKVDRTIREIIDNMVETMYEAPGIGLAANQVGELIQVVVIDPHRQQEEHGLIVLVNPCVVAAEGEMFYEEGCLSVPEYYANVKRYEHVCVRGLDANGKPVQIDASGLLAVVLQHELDHLNGRLFIDRINPIARDIFRRKWKKRQKQAVG
jgi:peptide deformylase